MKKKIGLFCSRGIGDGLLLLILSENFRRNGYEVQTYHRLMPQLQTWLPKLPLSSYPSEEEIPKIYQENDHIVLNVDSQPFMQAMKRYGLFHAPEKLWILKPTTCKGKGPFEGSFMIDPQKTMVKNLLHICSSQLNLKDTTKEIGLCPPKGLFFRKKSYRVIIHPMSSEPDKNWPQEKYLRVAEWLKKKGFEPVFVLADSERTLWKSRDFFLPETHTLDDLAKLIYESGYMLGSDSGVGHLASALGIPTLTIFSTKRKSFLWRPDWTDNSVLYPYPLLPNCKGLRFREKFWKQMISSRRVIKQFHKFWMECNEFA